MSQAVIVNDSPTQLELLKALVGDTGLEIRCFDNAEAALTAMNPQDPPLLLVTDLNMPGIDGWRFCRLLHSAEYPGFNRVPIVVVSATYAGEEPERIASDLGADAFFPYPLDAEVFVEKIRRILDGDRKLLSLRALIVEDSRTQALLLYKAFTGEGYQVDTAACLREGHACLSRHGYNLAAIDYHLPDGSGDSLLERIGSEQPECVCIMMTTDPGPELALEWLKRGAAAYLRKPFEPAYLLELAARVRRERSLLHVEKFLEVRTRKMRESEIKFRNLFEMNTDAVLPFDSETGRILDANPAAVRLYGYSREELLGMCHTELSAEPDKTRASITRARAGEVVDVPLRYHRKKDGTIFPVEVSIVSFPLDSRLILLPAIHDITERKRAEEALRASEERYKLIDSASRDCIYSYDRQGRFTHANGSLCRLLGLRAEQVLGKTHEELGFPPEQCAEWARLHQRVYETDATVVAETETPIPSGGRQYFEVVLNPMYDECGHIIGIAGTTRDINERKRSERILQESEGRLRSITDNIADTILQSDRSGRITYVNRIHPGLTRDQVLSSTIYDFVPPEMRSLVEEVLEQVFARGESRQYESLGPGPDDQWRYYDVTASPIFLGDQVISAVFLARDITDRKRMEEELARSANRLRIVLENAPGGIIAVERESKSIVLVNETICRMLGYRREEILQMSPADLHPPQARAAVMHEFERILRGEIVGLQDFPLLRRDGSVFFADVETTLLELDHQACVLGIFTDITEHKRAEEEKEKLKAQLIQAQKMESVGRLAGGVAHDFNNMLGVILGHVELALARLDTHHPVFDDLEEIRKAGERSAELTRQLLSFARKQVVSPRVLDLNSVIEGMLKMLRRLIGEDIELIWLPGSRLGHLKMDPLQIDQILANLCVNARDAIRGMGRITIETGTQALQEPVDPSDAAFEPGIYIFLAISDDGCGMDRETRGKLFEPFFTTKDVGKGTGLGLATVYGIVKQNRGFIEVDSEPGKGATFRIYFPRCDSAVEESRPDGKAGSSAGQGNETILLVEDDQAILNMTRSMLEGYGYRILAAATPADALRLAKNHSGRIHLLMTDVVMPGMNGRELASQILPGYPSMKVLYMSGYTADIIADQGVLDGGISFIEKPFRARDLTAKIRAALDASPEA